MEWELEVAVGTMAECGEKEARSGLTVANKRHDPDKKIERKDWTGPGSVGVSEQATVSDGSSWEGWTPYWNII